MEFQHDEKERFAPLVDPSQYELIDELCAKGELPTLKWLNKLGKRGDQGSASRAAASGNTVMIQWMIDVGWISWNKLLLIHALWGGQHECARWLMDQGCPHDRTTVGLQTRDGLTYIDVGEWLKANGYDG